MAAISLAAVAATAACSERQACRRPGLDVTRVQSIRVSLGHLELKGPAASLTDEGPIH